MNYIDEELGDPQLQRALETTAQPVIPGEIISQRELKNFLQTIQLSTIDLFISVFEAPTVTEGFRSAETRQKASRIVTSIQTLSRCAVETTQVLVHEKNRDEIELYLLLSSLALTDDEESIEREPPVPHLELPADVRVK